VNSYLISLPAGLCELILSLPYLVLLLFLFLCCCLCSYVVCRDLADVAMVSSPLVGRGYHSASMVGNQSTGRVSLPGQRCQPINRSSFSPGPALPTNQPVEFLSRALEISLWATKQNAQVSFCITWCDPGPPAPASREPKKGCRLPIVP
jgi:hypothetical protein